MDKVAFKQYLLENGFRKSKPYSESVVDERVRFCGTIETEFSVDLDVVVLDSSARNDLLMKVSGMKKSAVRRFEMALLAYYEFADSRSDAGRYFPMNGGHFYRLANDIPPKIYFDMLLELENHYECIMSFGRNLLGLEKQLLPHRLERIPVILSPAIKKKTYKADKVYWSQKIAELSQKKRGNVSPEEIQEILDTESFTHEITGEFFAGYNQFGPHIVLYYNVIDGTTFEEKVANFANVLAHEYMHYMEYLYCTTRGVTYCSNKNLSEAMADFFGVLYGINWSNKWGSAELLKVVRDRYELWRKRYGSAWPYAKALHFYTVANKTMHFSDNYADYEAHGSIEKLTTVFDHCDIPDLAYNILTND